MDNEDRQAIEELFVRLSEVERKASPRDADAERFIKDRINQQPSAPYLMAQTIVVQEYALKEAQRRILELERDSRDRQGRGLGSGIFGAGRTAGPGAMASVPSVPRAKASPAESMSAQGGRSGFLAGAAQTAMGVAGGLLLGNFIAGMLGGNEAEAADNASEREEDSEIEGDADQDDGGFLDGGDLEI